MNGDPDRSLDADVVVVGCGPVGLTTSVLLAQQGWSVVALERWPEPYPLPRAVHFDHEVARILQACGLSDDLRRITEPAEIYEWQNADGKVLLRFGRPGDGASGWPASNMFHQPELEALLASRCDELADVEIRRGVEVTSVDQDEDVVVVGTADGSTLSARFVIGCDGANSTVRELSRSPVCDLGFEHDWLIVDVILAEPRVFDPVNLQVCDPARPTTAVSGGPGRRRWEFMRLPNETKGELHDTATAWRLLEPWDVRPDNATIERQAVYTFNARYAEQWRAGRVLLAGDAGHLMPPFAGQGMCSGIRDAANLAWRLDLVLGGISPIGLLDGYQVERLDHVRNTIELSTSLGEIICISDPAAAAARDDAMTVDDEPGDDPPSAPITAGTVDDSLAAGHLFVQGRIDGRLADDVHGAGWRLVTTSHGEIDAQTQAWFESIGGAVVHLSEPDDVHRQWFADHDVCAALQRPDFHLFGTAASADEQTDLLSRLRARLTTPDPTPGAPA